MLPLPYRPALASAACVVKSAASSSLWLLPTTTAAASPLCRSVRQPSPHTVRQQQRSFSSTPAAQAKTIKPHRLPSNVIPPYPYGERRVYKQSNRGLYGPARIRFGNNVAPKHKIKTQRFWRPNVHVKRFVLPSVGANVKTRLTLRVLKTIRREGGLEEYLLKSKPQRVKDLGPGGWNLRWLLMQSRPVQERFNEERIALGLEPREIEDRDDIIQYALDFATPGPLSARSRATLGDLKAADLAAQLGLIGDAFVLGNDAELVEMDDVEELSDEAEEVLLKELDQDQADDVVVTDTAAAAKAVPERKPLES